MNQEQANRLINDWGILLLLDAPEGIELGIDNMSWKIGTKFKGIQRLATDHLID